MSEISCAYIDLRKAAMDLAPRLSSVQHFLPAAHQLLRCEQLSSDEINRHSRKIVALIEISRSTLLRCGLRLYRFASCMPALIHHKETYFNMLRMLKRLRQDMQDPALKERINRLLLPLSSNMHIPNAEDISTPSSPNYSQNNAYSESLLSPRSPSPPPTTVNLPATYNQQNEVAAMLPPDVLLSRPQRRRYLRDHVFTAIALTNSPPRGRRSRRLNPGSAPDDSFYDNINAIPPAYSAPRRKFGILFTAGRRPRH